MSNDDYIGRRLNPSRALPEFYTLDHLLRKVAEIASIAERSHWKPPIRVLDAGAGSAPYRSLFSKSEFDYVAVDSLAVPNLSAQAEAAQLPFFDGSFDVVLSNQVLEHVTDPCGAARELQRVLSDRGYLLVSCPFVWEVHNFPADYWRFSSQALRLLFSEMDLVYLEPSTSTAQCLAQTFNLFINRNSRSESWKKLLFRITNSRLLLRLLPASDSLLPSNYVVLARKLPAAAQPSIDRGARMHVDAPGEGASLSGSTIRVSGWVVGDFPLQFVSARIDNCRESKLRHSLPRLDVWRAFPEYRFAHRSGFEGECEMADVSAGEHQLRVKAEAGGVPVSRTVRIFVNP
ncbi:MAG TPA: class I SAM-dependent methyltransferase [Acidobacteriota bacterium]|jgi:SAM-dependent methyltransferase